MCMWARLSLETPGFIGHQARQALAKHNEAAGYPIGERFFHYRDGAPISDALPPVRIQANGYRVEVIGLGNEGANLVYDHARTITELLMQADTKEGERHIPTFRFTQGQLAMTPMQYHRRYVFRSLALHLPPAVREALKNGAEPDMAIITERLQHAWQQAAEQWLANGPVPTIKNVTVTRSLALRRSRHGNRYITLLDGEFDLAAKLSGPWAIGSLQARGYGRLHPARASQSQRGAA